MRRRTKDEWKELVEDYNKSKLSPKEWCEKNNINKHTFYDVLYKLKKEQSRSVIEWTKIPVTACEALATETTIENIEENSLIQNTIEVKIEKFSINIAKEFNEQAFTKICKVLKSIC